MRKRALAVLLPAAFMGTLIVIAALPQTAGQAGEAAAPAAAPAVSYDPSSVPAGTYVVDPQHSALTGALRHAGLSHFVFRFKRFDARFTYDPEKPDAPNIEVTIDPSSIDTNVAGFDTNIATSERHFNTAKFPEIKFVSNSLKRTGLDKGVMEGNITFLGVTKPLSFDVTFLGVRKARNSATVAFSAATTLLRSDFGFAAGSDNLADVVAVAVEADFIQQLPQ